MTKNKTLVLGICGPVGVGKTLLIKRIQEMLSERYSLATLSDGIFTVKDLNYVPPLMTPSRKSRDFSHGMDRPLLSPFMG
ncbi:urease accessory protein UreG, partial [Ligilactobacillus murinus]|nr:urease accessory protein UreG [Ligilactobacillus murinus]